MHQPLPPSTDPVRLYIKQYHSILTQYHQVSTSTDLYWPSTIMYQPVPPYTDQVPPSTNQYRTWTAPGQLKTGNVAWGLETSAQFTPGLVFQHLSHGQVVIMASYYFTFFLNLLFRSCLIRFSDRGLVSQVSIYSDQSIPFTFFAHWNWEALNTCPI